MKKYYIEFWFDTGHIYDLQSKWFDTKEEAIEWLKEFDYINYDACEIHLMSMPFDEEENEFYGDIVTEGRILY